jgi:hypothetical protein
MQIFFAPVYINVYAVRRMQSDRLAATRVFNILHRVFHRLVEGIPQDYVNRCKYDQYKRPAERIFGCILLFWIYLCILPEGMQVPAAEPANSGKMPPGCGQNLQGERIRSARPRFERTFVLRLAAFRRFGGCIIPQPVNCYGKLMPFHPILEKIVL